MKKDTGSNPNPKRSFNLPLVIGICLITAVLGFTLGVNIDSFNISRYDSVNQQLPENLDFTSVEEVYDHLRQKFAGQLDEQELLEGLKKGLVDAAGDPFTEYLDKEAAQELQESLDGEFGGIGAEIGVRDSQIVVIAPLEGTPAAEAGLRPQDAILAIDGEDTSAMSLQQAVMRIRGEEGTQVTLTIGRGDQPNQDITITRGRIEVPSVNAEMLEDGVGYIELVQFGNDTARDFRDVARRLRNQGADKIILDLRGNPGGFLDAAVAIASEFLEPGKVIVEERRNDEVISTERSSSGGVLEGVEVVVLINQGSASASEIIAGALRDNNVARLVGEQTFGKGSVQELVRLKSGGVLRVTIAKWYTPNGLNINEQGVEPDIEVELTEDDFEQERDPQLKRALELLR